MEENSSVDETASHIGRMATETKSMMNETHELFSDAEESACLDTTMNNVGRPTLVEN